MNPIMVLHHLSRGKGHQRRHVVEPVTIHNPYMIRHVLSGDAQGIRRIRVPLKRCLPIFRTSQWFEQQTRSCESGSHWDPSPAHPHIGSQGPYTIQDHKGEVKKDSVPTGILNSSCWANPTLVHFLHLHAQYLSSTRSSKLVVSKRQVPYQPTSQTTAKRHPAFTNSQWPLYFRNETVR